MGDGLVRRGLAAHVLFLIPTVIVSSRISRPRCFADTLVRLQSRFGAWRVDRSSSRQERPEHPISADFSTSSASSYQPSGAGADGHLSALVPLVMG
ncbi:hypothetical protein PYCCODRAFT_1278042 [Trametes coccinea BRFM310]|uniref:Secreted protein n=1 Tax=Trametes coccinea (strain BRFM310) TaxID=1353009 RepID=A0A1Y2IVA9_TRAC3|nr:hypothetical protein PYCCODRAFT_1278042 [Trametes coccinea BRFM310]